MSLFDQQTVTCPACEHSQVLEFALSLNAARRPDLRDAVLDGSYQRFACENCDATFRIEPRLTYLDIQRNQWYLVKPVQDVAHWSEFEVAAQVIFDEAYGEKAPAAARAVGAEMQVRVLFGWQALREKLLCQDAGLDDVTLELAKLVLVRAGDELPLADNVELRFAGVEGDDLRFNWVSGETERPIETMLVPRKLYDDIAADPASWQKLRDQLLAGTFVDFNRLLVPETP